ncbi:hypothetical protein SAMN05444580_104240 [Rhodococcus tukisamuensis]|uniref:Uncharacterized protein n=1 Tax=Rhodococcus tukisamuensis TaxID=168276 RepID=A0A1G6UMM0_9NOCA|nr:hypothetical protein SAMN05444580_104240 [Rhodococcus tukisamuensis]
MNTRKLSQLLAATALSTAVVTGAAAPASAAPRSNPLAPIAASVENASAGGSGAPEGLTADALIAARNAGLPIYESGRVVIVSATKMGAIYATEYRRVHDVDALDSPATKFVVVGAAAPDNFYVVHGYNNRDSIVVNMRPSGDPVWGGLSYDTTPQSWWNSPLVQLPGGGPDVGVAFVR